MRLGRFYNLEQRSLLMKSFVESQFAYSPLVWMFHDRGSNNKINRVHERALRFVYKDDIHTFKELLIRDNSVTIHHRNIHAVAIEMFKSLHNVQIDLMDDIFIKSSEFNVQRTRSQNDFMRPRVNTVHYGNDSLRDFGPRVWNILPNEIKSSTHLSDFRAKIKKWIPSECPCRLCTIYIGGLGYI